MEGQTVSLYFQTEAVVPSKTHRQKEQTSLTAKCFDKMANKKFHCAFSVSWKTSSLHPQPLHSSPRPHRSSGCKLIVSLLLSVTPSSILLSPAGFLSLRKNSSMYIQVDQRTKNAYLHSCPSFIPLPSPLYPPLTPLGLCSCFLFSPSPIPLFLFSCQWADFFLRRGAAD